VDIKIYNQVIAYCLPQPS